MNPTLSYDRHKNSCTNIISASCVLWNGPTYDCITTCTGDSVVDVISKTAVKVCELSEQLDLSQLDIDCLANNCTGCSLCAPGDKVLKNVLECVIQKYCLLKARVDLIPLTPGSGDCPPVEEVFTFDPTCLATRTGDSMSTPITNSVIIQYVADAICTTYDELDARITQLNIDLITCCNGGGGGTGTIPQVNSSCLFVGLKGVDEAYLLLDDDYCSLKTVLGATADISTSLNPSAPCSTTINDYLATTIGSATTLDGSITNIYDVLCALTDKVKTIGELQASCCTFSCDSIDIVALSEVSDLDAKTINLIFTFNGSPDPFPYTIDDAGVNSSKVTFTDKNGRSLTLSFDLSDDSTYTDMVLTGLDLTDNIVMTIVLNYTVTRPGDENVYNCNKCLSSVLIINTDCAVCGIIISGGTGINVKITYTEPDSSVHVIVISSTGTYYVPTGSTIDAVVDDSTTPPTITSECDSMIIPTPAVKTCWQFIIPPHLFLNYTDVTPDENEVTDFDITGIIVNGTRYSLGPVASNLGIGASGKCACAGGGAFGANEAGTSLPSYVSGSITYTNVTEMTNLIATLNAGVGTSNPNVKEFTSACSGICDDGCMQTRYLYVTTFGTSVPQLEMKNSNLANTYTTVIQMAGQEVIGNCYCTE